MTPAKVKALRAELDSTVDAITALDGCDHGEVATQRQAFGLWAKFHSIRARLSYYLGDDATFDRAVRELRNAGQEFARISDKMATDELPKLRAAVERRRAAQTGLVALK